MAIGRTFKEALQKGLRGLEIGVSGFARTRPRRRAHQGEAAHARPRPHLLRQARARPGLGARRDLPHDRDRPLVPRPDRSRSSSSRRSWRRACDSASPTRELLREAKRMGFSDVQLGAARGQTREARSAPRARRAGHRARLQARRHLRGRVRVAHALPLLDLRARGRGGAHRPPEGHDPRQRPQPHRPGDRVRLLLLPRLLRLQGGGLRDHHGQLQPGDGLDRLRHLRPALLRAAHLRGRAERRRDGEARRRGRPVRRPDAAEAGACRCTRPGVQILGTSPDAIDLAEDRKRFSALLAELGIPQPESGTAVSLEEAKAVAERIGYPVLVRPSYVLGGRAMAIVYDDEPPRGATCARRSRPRPSTRSCRPLPRGRLRGRRRRARRRRARGDRRHHAAHRGGRHPLRRLGVVLPPYKIAPRAPRDDPRLHARAWAWRSGARA